MNRYSLVSKTKDTGLVPEGGFEYLAARDLFGAVVVAVEDVSEDGLIGWDVGFLAAVEPFGAGFRQG